MYKLISKVLLLGTCLFLTACSTGRTENTSTESNKKENAAQINTRLGLAYLQRHDIQRAKQKLLMALDQDPALPEPWYAMAYLLQITGNNEQANKYYLKAIELAPGRGDTSNNYGTFLCRTGKYDDAIKQFIIATKDPKYLNTASAYENAGLCALKIPNNALAMQYFNRAIEEDPMRPTTLIELAQLNYKKGDIQLAKHQLDQFLQLSSPTVESYELENKIDAKISTETS